jgi:hypothetical protein
MYNVPHNARACEFQSINLIHLGISYKCTPKVSLSSCVGHRISSSSAWLMHDAINITSSHNVNFNQFHIKSNIHNDIVIFHVDNEVQKTLFKCQF